MTSLFEDLQSALTEAIADAKGKKRAQRTKIEYEPVKEFSQKEIRQIRINANMTQRSFAMYMGVSVKTVESWEQGKSHPNGPAFRLMQVLSSPGDKKPQFVKITKFA